MGIIKYVKAVFLALIFVYNSYRLPIYFILTPTTLTALIFALSLVYNIFIKKTHLLDRNDPKLKRSVKNSYRLLALMVVFFITDSFTIFYIWGGKNGFENNNRELLNTLSDGQSEYVQTCVFFLSPLANYVCPQLAKALSPGYPIHPTSDNFDERLETCFQKKGGKGEFWRSNNCESALRSLKYEPLKEQLKYYEFISRNLSKTKDCQGRHDLIAKLENSTKLYKEVYNLYFLDCTSRECSASCDSISGMHYNLKIKAPIKQEFKPYSKIVFKLMTYEFMKKETNTSHELLIAYQKEAICWAFNDKNEIQEGKLKAKKFIKEHVPQFDTKFPYHLFDAKDYPPDNLMMSTVGCNF